MWDTRSIRYHDGRIETPGGPSPEGSARMVLLIHGYNNDKRDADESYAAMVEHLPDELRAVKDQIWKFFWPSFVDRLTGSASDESLSLLERRSSRGTESNAALSGPSYPWQVLKAPEVGRALGRYLRQLTANAVPTEIVIVAHSLGCRVALEALRQMIADSSLAAERMRLPSVCFMAAAVPTFMVAEGARLGDAALVPQTSYVLHSAADLVLRAAFPGGQGAATVLRRSGYPDTSEDAPASDEGWWPEAVGRYGNPTTVWIRRGNTGLGHSDYWGHPSTAPSVLRALGRRTVSDLDSLASLQAVSWTLPAFPDLPDWEYRTAARGDLRARPFLG